VAVPPRGRRSGGEDRASPTGSPTVTTQDLRRALISHLIVGLGLDAVWVSKIAGHSKASVTLDVYAEEFD
jgi:integrase